MKRITALLVVVLLFFMPSSVKAQSYGFGINKSYNGATPNPGSKITKIINDTNSAYIGNTDEKEIYLTFDTGYENGQTSKILDTLKSNNVNATFFVTGHFIKTNNDLITRMSKEGHNVGNHTYSHPDVTNITFEKFKSETDKLNSEYKKITNKDLDMYFRPPRGMVSHKSMKYANDLGYKNVLWSLAFVDWNIDNQKGYMYSYNNVVNHIHNGAIVLLHTVSKDNADALDKIIKDLRTKGYTFKNLDELK